MVNAMDLACNHDLTIWDSVVLAASAEAECRLLLSEDLQEGFTWRGVTVTNPFAPRLHTLLAAILADPCGRLFSDLGRMNPACRLKPAPQH
jgi:hypothetical protein